MEPIHRDGGSERHRDIPRPRSAHDARGCGNTRAWQRGDVLYRIEGDIDLDRALAIARSMS
jgi:hypothetical protein